MRLSDLKALVAEIEAKKTTDDPKIYFWIHRSNDKPGPRESDCFINYTLDLNAIAGSVNEHKIIGPKSGHKGMTVCDTVYEPGDFTFPLTVSPFYAERVSK